MTSRALLIFLLLSLFAFFPNRTFAHLAQLCYPAYDATYVNCASPDTPFPYSQNLFLNSYNDIFLKFSLYFPQYVNTDNIVSVQIILTGTAVNDTSYINLMDTNDWDSYTLTYNNCQNLITGDTPIGQIANTPVNFQIETSTINVTNAVFQEVENSSDLISFHLTSSAFFPGLNIYGLYDNLMPEIPMMIINYKVPDFNISNIRSTGSPLYNSSIIGGCFASLYLILDDALSNATYDCQIMLGDQLLADNSSNVYLLASGSSQFTTDSNGDYTDTLYFDTTQNLQNQTYGDLYLQLVNAEGNIESNQINGVSLYNQAYITCDCIKFSPFAGNEANYATLALSPNYPNYYLYNNPQDYYTVYPLNGAEQGQQSKLQTLSNLPNIGLPSVTVFYTCADGNWDGYHTLFDSPTEDGWVSQVDIQNCISTKNPQTQPSFQFVFIDCCESAGAPDQLGYTALHNDMAISFGILNQNGSTNFSQAYLGWTQKISACSNSQTWDWAFWQAIKKGDSINGAITYANTVAPTGNYPSQVFGDPYTKLFQLLDFSSDPL